MKKSKKILKILNKYESFMSEKDLKDIKDLLNLDNDSEDIFSLFTDGACQFNDEYEPVNAGIGVVLKKNDKTILEFSDNIGIKTNNEAEYFALIKGIELCIKNGVKNILIYADSELVVKQVNREYKVKNDRMNYLFNEVSNLLSKLDSWSLNHILRDKNSEADELSKQGLSKEKTNV
tara:strand:- start:186 stop:716 length:531 start_codon:yes stop_codon:yes gene_type:complete